MARKKGINNNQKDTSNDFDRHIFPIEKFKIDDNVLDMAELVISFFRQFPHIFVEVYLSIKLYPFQIVALHQMMHKNNVICIECRNLGKTFLTALYIVTRCILYPKTKVIISAPEKQQSAETITKIKEIMMSSPQLRSEISVISDAIDSCRVIFHNGSTVRTATMSNGSRSHRANLLVCDEAVWMEQQIVDDVLTNFLGDPRAPEYLKNPEYFGKPEYEYLKEPDTEIYLSSAGHESGWLYRRFVDYSMKMLNGNKDFFVCDIPYQTAVKQGLRKKDFYVKQMNKDGFDESRGKAEYEGIFMRENELAYFKFDALDNCREIEPCVYDKSLQEYLFKNCKVKKDKKEDGVIRICGGDLSSVNNNKNNDASCFGVLQLLPRKRKVRQFDENGNGKDKYISYYKRELIFVKSINNMLMKDQMNELKRMYEDFDCDYMVLDSRNAGSVAIQQLGEPSQDENGRSYPAYMSIANDDFAEMCAYKSVAKRVLYCISATDKSNDDDNRSLHNQITRIEGRMRLLVNPHKAKDYHRTFMNFDSIPQDIRTKMIAPYLETEEMITEMISLEKVDNKNNYIKLKEPSRHRKDRYSMLLYLNHVADIYEDKLRRFDEIEEDEEGLDDLGLMEC